MKNINQIEFDDVTILQKMEQATVLVIGDIMLDRFIYGSVDRISPESPVPVLSVKRENTMLGGAGNTVFNLINLKCEARVLSIVGDDTDGETIACLLREYGIDETGLIREETRPTIVKTRFLAGHQQLLRTDFERIEKISKNIEEQILEKAKQLIRGVKAIILSDYGKGMLTKSLLKQLISLANKNKIPVLVDPKGLDYSIYRGADVITPNKKELSEALAGLDVETDEKIVHAAQKLISQSGVKSVVATRSKDGISVVKKDSATHIRSAADIEVFDVSGAGDTVIATIAASLAAGASLEQAASIANIAGSIVVSKVGTAPIRAEELARTLHDNDIKIQQTERTRQAPVLKVEEAREEILRWKARSLKVGFTNGCFDIMHFGHVNYLNDARKKCDRLIVGMNSDSSVKILKGPDRPVHDEQSRAAVLGALGSVDMVVLFGAREQDDDNTACGLLAVLQPDIYFKGGDYSEGQIPESPTVRKYGGTIEIMPVYDGHSTTKSIAKIKVT